MKKIHFTLSLMGWLLTATAQIPVSWTQTGCISVSQVANPAQATNNSLCSPTSMEDYGTSATNLLIACKDGYVEATIENHLTMNPPGGQVREWFIGLDAGQYVYPLSPGANQVDFGLYITEDNTGPGGYRAYMIVNGHNSFAYEATLPSSNPIGTVITVKKTGNSISFLQNGTVINCTINLPGVCPTLTGLTFTDLYPVCWMRYGRLAHGKCDFASPPNPCGISDILWAKNPAVSKMYTKFQDLNVGVGTYDPAEKLHVGGNVRINGLGLAGGGVALVAADENGKLLRKAMGSATDLLDGTGNWVNLNSVSPWTENASVVELRTPSFTTFIGNRVASTSYCSKLSVDGGINVDANALTNYPNWSQNALRFGFCEYGIGIASNNSTSVFNPKGMDFYTNNLLRLSLQEDGNFYIGAGTNTGLHWNWRTVIDNGAGSANNNRNGLKVITNHSQGFGFGILSVVFHNDTKALVVENPNVTTGLPLFLVEGDGDLFGKGVFRWSDQRFKRDVKTIDNGLSIIKRLNGVTYTLDLNEFKGGMANAEQQIGFIAQEVKEVLPMAVKENEQGYFAVDYEAIIPVLTQAIKEQQLQIEALQQQLGNGGSNQNFPGSLPGSDTDIRLYQNNPNPFNTETRISYYLPENIQNGRILVFDLQGKQIKSFTLDKKGNAELIINGSELQAGMYIYTLVADNKVIDSKRMILTQE